ncbi:MAG: hypothetical protein GW859_08015 [Sphingomonadales bacterium]|nr:hypothetical protein [Sphingomonadales bacterium]
MRTLLLALAIAALASCNEPDAFTQAASVDRSPLTMVNDDTWKAIEALQCKPTRVYACGPEGCEEGKAVVSVRWEPKGSYQRCDKSGCDSYKPVVSHSGIWTVVSLPQNGTMAKFTSDGYYMEVATIDDSALVYHGQCEMVARTPNIAE